MRNRPGWGVLCSVALLALVLAGPAWGQQDTWAGVERIVAVGDVHGDHEQFVKTLRAADVIDEKENWTAGKAHLVQLGDALDRGPDSRKVMDLLMKLEKQAADAGGAVHPLLGNHEAMVLLGDWRYVIPEEEEAFGGAEPYRAAMSATGKYGRWIRSHNAVIRINDLLFVHAGVTALCAGMPLARINQTIREELNKGVEDGLAMHPAGPLWDRTLAVGDGEDVEKQLDAVLKAFGVRRMVVGHTPSLQGVEVRAGGRLLQADVGLSGFYRGPAACLVVEKGGFYEVRDPNARRALPVGEPTSRPAAEPRILPAATQPAKAAA